MASFPRYSCHVGGCKWFTDKVGDWRGRVLEHARAAHSPALVSVPPGAVQSDAAALAVRPLAICRTCHQLPCACPQDVIATPAPADAPHLSPSAGAGLPFAPEEPDDPEARAYLDALRMVYRVLDERSTNELDALLADIRDVVGVYGRSLELGGAREGRA